MEENAAKEIEIEATQKPETDLIFTAADTVFAFAMLICGFLYWNLIKLYWLGAGVTVFAALLFAITYIYLSKSGIKQNAGSLTCLGLAAISAAQFALFDNLLISSLNFIFISALYIYWICLCTGRRIDKEISAYIIGDAVKQGLSIPFQNFGCCASGIKNHTKKKQVKVAVPALIGILFFLPLIIAVIRLLATADLAFESFISSFLNFISIEKIMNYIWQFILGIPVAFYLYGLVYGDVKGRHTDKITIESVDRAAATIRIAPKAAMYSALTVFNIIYLVFFAVQAAYLFSAFYGSLPEEFTYAEYARRGFFELCAVAGINLVVVIITHLLMEKEQGEEPRALRIETIIISSFTILLIATALSKMALYINAYGLTQLRVFTSWFMILLLFIFLAINVRQIKKYNLVKSVITGFVIMFMLLSFGNVDGLIAKYNIGRYEAGTLSEFDLSDMSDLSDAAVPYLYNMYLLTNESDLEMREQLVLSILNKGRSYGTGDFRGGNLQRYRADEIRALLY